GGDGRELLPAEPGTGREHAAEQREDVATRTCELPNGVEAIPYLRDATNAGIELSAWDHGIVTWRHALGQTGDEVTVARDHHERPARFVSKRQRHPGGALGQANLFQQRPDEQWILVERQRQLGLRRGQALESLEEVDIMSSVRHRSSPRHC